MCFEAAIDQGQGKFRIVRAANIEPKSRQAFYCADENCRAPMGLVTEHEMHANSTIRNQHFRTLPSQKHDDSCKIQIQSKQDTIERKKFNAALKPDSTAKIILRLNFDPNFKTAVRSSNDTYAENHLIIPFTMATNTKDFAYKSIRCVEDALYAYDIIKNAGEGVMERSFIERDGHYLPLSEFIIMKEERRIETLARRLQNVALETSGRALAFPRLILLSLDKATLKGEYTGKIVSKAIPVVAHWRSPLTQNSRNVRFSMFGHSEEQDRIKACGFNSYCIVTLYMTKTQAERATREQDKGDLYLNFTPVITDAACIGSNIPDYTPDIIKKPRAAGQCKKDEPPRRKDAKTPRI